MNKLFLLLFLSISFLTKAQTVKPDLHNSQQWQVINRNVEPITENGKKAIRFNEVANEGVMLLNNYEFSNGTIEFDVKGKNVLQQSFVGIAFHAQNEMYDAIYFRPFNFMNPDTIRRPRSVQYISMPNYGWEKLRADSPGKYENKVNPVPNPDDWFHAKITVAGKRIKVFVNHSTTPSLEVEKLSAISNGKIGLWMGNNSGGSFANLEITPEKTSYGNSPKNGNYFNVGDANLYYEIYGKGKSIVLLHGGVYGYIDEFEPFISRLSSNYQVICIATRGHGKSEMGASPFTWQQRAEDAYKVIRSITKDSVTVLGFSDGAYSGYKLAAMHPELVTKLIAIGAGDRPKNRKVISSNYTPEKLLSQSKEYFETRLAMMPEPKRWGECLAELNKLYDTDFLSKETFEKIKCPVLVIGGDRDSGQSIEALTRASKMISKSQLSIIPDCHHVVFHCNFPAVWEGLLPFLE